MVLLPSTSGGDIAVSQSTEVQFHRGARRAARAVPLVSRRLIPASACIALYGASGRSPAYDTDDSPTLPGSVSGKSRHYALVCKRDEASRRSEPTTVATKAMRATTAAIDLLISTGLLASAYQILLKTELAPDLFLRHQDGIGQGPTRYARRCCPVRHSAAVRSDGTH